MREHGRGLDGRTVGRRAQTGCGRRRREGGSTVRGLRGARVQAGRADGQLVIIIRARLPAAAAPHRGDWLHTLPISACGLHLEDSAIRVAVGLRLGCAIFETHPCPCGATVDPLN